MSHRSSFAAGNPWLLFQTKVKPALRLFCFPYAAGGASIFRQWPRELAAEIEVCPVQLPGRESRRKEAAFERLTPMVEALAVQLEPVMQEPFAFFGHSMGALISFELARVLRRLKRPGPVHLFLSAHRAPQMPDPDPPMHALPEKELIERLIELNGTPPELLKNPELMSFFLPIVRSDAAVCETYQAAEEPPLACRGSLYGGLSDPKVSRDELAAWQLHFEQTCQVRMFPGDHFFINHPGSGFLPVFTRDVNTVLREAAGRS